MRTRILYGLAATLAACSLTAAVLLTRPAPPAAPNEMAAAVQRVLDLLDAEQRARATYPFASEERQNWFFVPIERKGLTLAEMNLEQRRAVHDLLQTVLSSRGYLKATSIMHLESILKVMENNSPRRDPERYYLTVFGDPSSGEPWGWRFEGHHLSLNFSSITNELMATTPAFMGTNPAEVRQGPYAGWRVLAAEEDLGRALLHALNPAQRAKAVIDSIAPNEIVTSNARKAVLDHQVGLPASEMTGAQQAMLRDIIHEVVANMRPELAGPQLEKIEAAGIGNLYFAWAGSPDRGERQAHYYRIHGPTVLFEYDNAQNDANHVHVVWRDLTDDFGEDLLRKHYAESPHE